MSLLGWIKLSEWPMENLDRVDVQKWMMKVLSRTYT